MSDVLFGNNPQTVDDRYRVCIPAKHLPSLRGLCGVSEGESIEVVVAVTPDDCVGVYPKPVFERILAELDAHPNRFDAEEAKRMYLKNRDDMALDKSNRVRIPQWLARKYRLSGEVLVAGVGTHLEITNADDFDQQHDKDMGGFKGTLRRLSKPAAAEE